MALLTHRDRLDALQEISNGCERNGRAAYLVFEMSNIERPLA